MKQQATDFTETAEKKYKVLKKETADQAKSVLKSVEQQIEDSMGFVQETWTFVQGKIETAVKENPAKVISGVFSAGILVGMTLARLKKGDSDSKLH